MVYRRADVVLALGHEKMNEGDSQTTVMEPFYQRYFLSGAPGDILVQIEEEITENE